MTHDKIKIAREVLKLEADALYNLVKLIGDEFEKAIQLIIERKGRVLVIGLGKSGHVGKKIAATLASTGQPSFFIHATEAAHGDLGMITSDDTCIMISHSGNTKELLEMIPALKRFGVPIISLTGNSYSKLANLSDVVLNTYVTKEACPYNLAPTTSSTATLAYGDALAITLLKLRGFEEEQFALYHPSGTLGKRLIMRVSDVMIEKDLPKNNETDTFRDALSTMTKGRQGVTLIINSKVECIGILTDGDIRRTLEQFDKVSEIKLSNIYTKNPKTITLDALAVEALKKMQDSKITSLVVVDKNKSVVGLLHIHHLLEKGFN